MKVEGTAAGDYDEDEDDNINEEVQETVKI